MANDELYTPRFIFDSLKIIFDLDVCAPVGGPKHTPAIEYFDIHSDGLKARWFGTVWMNPPYSNPRPWIDKFIEHGNGIALVPFAKSQWFIDLWNSPAVGLPLPVNTKFISGDKENHSIWMPTSLWAMGEHSIIALKRSGLANVR
jgi:hypothetical protein